MGCMPWIILRLWGFFMREKCRTQRKQNHCDMEKVYMWAMKWVKEWIYHLVLKIAVHYASWLKTTRLESSLLSFTKHFIMEGVHCLLLNRHCLLPHFLEMPLMTDMEKKIPCDRWSEWAIVSGRVNIPSCIKNIRSLRFTVKTRSPWIFTSIVYETFYFFGSTLFIAEQCLFFPLLHAEKVCSKGIRGYLQADYMVDSWEGYKLCDVACLHFHCITNYKFCIEFAIPQIAREIGVALLVIEPHWADKIVFITFFILTGWLWNFGKN